MDVRWTLPACWFVGHRAVLYYKAALGVMVAHGPLSL